MRAAGGLIGLLAALVGAGGAFVSVPFMTWRNVKIHPAVATSAALGFPIAAAGTLGHVIAGWSLHDMPPGTLGFVYLRALLTISANRRADGAARCPHRAPDGGAAASAHLRSAVVRPGSLHDPQGAEPVTPGPQVAPSSKRMLASAT